VRRLDGGKRLVGRKRPLLVDLVDTDGLLLKVVVSPATVSERDGARLVAHALLRDGPDLSRIQRLWVDAGSRGLERLLGWQIEGVTHPKGQHGFQVVPRRWVVERSFGWLGRFRRLSKDDDYRLETSEAWIEVASSVHLLRRLAAVPSPVT